MVQSEWNLTTIGEQASLQRGIDITKLQQRPGAIPVVSSGGIFSYHDTPIAQGPGVVLARKGNSIGRVQYVESDYWPHDTTLWVTDFHNNDPRFVYYFFLNLYPKLAALDVGSANPTLNRNHVHPMEVLWPPTNEQRIIADVLGSLDDRIELNRRMNETLEGMARAIFKSWFADFDPVWAKAAGRQPSGMDTDTAELFPDRFVDSSLGKIPKGWSTGTVGDVSCINCRGIKKDYPHKVIKYIDISSVTVGRLEGATDYPLVQAPSRAQRLVAHGDTIWSCVRPNRRSFLFIHQPEENLVVSTGFAVLTPCAVPPCYLYACLTTDEFVDYLTYNADGSAYPAVRPDRFAAAPIVLPSPSVLERFEAIVGRLRERIGVNERESRTLATARDALLPKLLSGKVRVGDLEREAVSHA